MKIIYEKLFVPFFFVSIFFVPAVAFAHQPRIALGPDIYVSDPEISKAYYGQLSGEPHFFKIVSDKRFVLYLNILVPDIEGQKKDLSFAIIKNGDLSHPIATLNGINFEWKKFWEEFGRDSYWQGPEYRAYADPGEYEIRLWSSNNDSKYSFAIGGNESVTFKEAVNELSLIPKIKRDFFKESPVGFIFSPFGYGYIVVIFFLAGICGFIYRYIRKRFLSSKGTVTNLNYRVDEAQIHIPETKDYFLIFLLTGFILIFFAIFTTWNPLVIFFSGLAFFEAIFSRYGIYSI